MDCHQDRVLRASPLQEPSNGTPFGNLRTEYDYEGEREVVVDTVVDFELQVQSQAKAGGGYRALGAVFYYVMHRTTVPLPSAFDTFNSRSTSFLPAWLSHSLFELWIYWLCTYANTAYIVIFIGVQIFTNVPRTYSLSRRGRADVRAKIVGVPGRRMPSKSPESLIRAGSWRGRVIPYA